MKKIESFLHNLEDMMIVSEAIQTRKLSDMTPQQHSNFRQNEAEAVEWHKNHPVSHENIVHHFNQATDSEKRVGENWYSDAHHITGVMAKDSQTPMHTMAGLMSNYSPQTHWATNMMTASRVARTKEALGGRGSGVFADEKQKAAAQRMLNGEHYDKVLSGQKTRAFAHLIEHGQSKDPEHPQVVIDRHAYSVAAGGRMTDAAFAQAKLKSKKVYNHVSSAYKQAADHLSKEHGRKIEPHQVQAVTWLVRQRLNANEEKQRAGSSKTSKMAANAKTKWDAYAGEHHPSIIGKEPGTGY